MPEHGSGPQRILSIGYTTLAQAVAKGIVWDDPASVLPWYNPGGLFPQATVFIPFGKEDVDREVAPGVRYIEWSFKPKIPKAAAGVFRLLPAAFFVRKLQREQGIDVIRLNGPHFPALIGVLLRLICPVPMLLFVEGFWEELMQHQANFPRALRRVLPIWYRLTYRLFDAYCGTPTIDPQHYVSRGMKPELIAPWMHEIDLATLERAADRETIPAAVAASGRPRLVAVGRLHAEKHAIDLVQALSIVRRQHPGACLILVGDGDERAAVEQRAAELGVADAVIITGQLSQPMALAIVKQCDVYTAPMQGNALVEAMAAQKPIVAYDHAWHRNLVRDGETAILAADHNPEAMAAGVDRLMRDPAAAASMAVAARREAYFRFAPLTVAKTLAAGFEMAWLKYWNIAAPATALPAE